MANESIYRIIFVNENEVFELYARNIYQSDLFGFLEVEEFVFGSRHQMVVDPGEERLKTIFAEVKRSFIPVNMVIRIDEVQSEGVGKITEAKGVVAPFPQMAVPKKDV